MAYPKRPSREELSSPEVLKAVALQNDYRARVQLTDDFGAIRRIAGIDTGYDLERGLAKAVVAVMAWPSLELETTVIAYEKVDFPYIPGFLAFREIPAILRGLDCLIAPPDMLMVDGQGVAHPRRMGIAAHLGVVTGLPAIGVAKSRLTGRCGALPQDSEFATTPLMDKEERIGTVLGSKRNCNPLYVSAGHRVSQETALSLTLQCFRGYRLPEPTRIADQISKWKLPGMDGLVSKAAKKKSRPDDSTGDLFQ